MSIRPSPPSLLSCLSRPGPSRLALRRRVESSCPSCARAASTDSTTNDYLSPRDDHDDDMSIDDRGSHSRDRSDRDKLPEPSGPGYEIWLREVGSFFKEPPNNGPNWFGGDRVSFLVLCTAFGSCSHSDDWTIGLAIPHQSLFPTTSTALGCTQDSDI